MVLIIEDDDDTRDVYEAFFSGVGLRVRCAATATEGIAMARAERPDAIVMDMSLPDASGVDVRRALLADEQTRAVPVLALTGKELSEIDRSLFPDVMRKPADLDGVVAWLHRAATGA